MSVTITIKQRGLFKKKFTMDDVVSWLGLSYGVMDDDFVLEEDKIGDSVTFYDSKRIGRGFDCRIVNKGVEMRLNLPNTNHDIELFYQAVQTIGEHLKVKTVLWEDMQMIPFRRFPEFMQSDRDTSVSALRHFQKETSNKPDSPFMMFAVRNPISLGQKHLDAVDGDLDKFEELLHKLQSEDYFYARFRFFKKDEASGPIIGVSFVGDNILSVVPAKPEKPIGCNDEIKGYYVRLPGNNVPLQVFLDNVVPVGEYDADHIKVCLDEKQINGIIAKGTVDAWTGEAVPCVPYRRNSNAQ